MLREADEDRADSVIAYTQQCVVVPLSTEIALAAAELHQRYRLATADAIVYATAQSQGADLLTCNAHFKRLPAIVYFRKRGQLGPWCSSRRGGVDSLRRTCIALPT